MAVMCQRLPRKFQHDTIGASNSTQAHRSWNHQILCRNPELLFCRWRCNAERTTGTIQCI